MPLSLAPGAKRSGDWHEGQRRTPCLTGCTQHPPRPYTSAWGLLRTPGEKVLPASFSCEDTEAKVEMCLSGPGTGQAERGPGTGLPTPAGMARPGGCGTSFLPGPVAILR